jgi:putative spermidine/putrescine transport system substrate-binding protein
MEFLYSDEGQLLWMKGYCHPVREADLYAKGKVPLSISTKVANLSGVYFPSPEQFSAAKEFIASNWDGIVGLDIR